MKKGKAPSSNGVLGIAHKILAGELVDVFAAALTHIMEPDTEIPVEFLDGIWVPVGEVPYPAAMKHFRPYEDRTM